MDRIFNNVVLQWVLRRGMELGGIAGALVAFYSSLPPQSQAAIGQLFTRDWQNVTLGALAPIALAVWGYVWSFRATVKPHVVTTDKVQVSTKRLPPAKATLVDEYARNAAKHQPNPLQKLFGKEP